MSMAEQMDIMDRIMDLPPCIIHHIMSFFSSKELAQSSVLSKRWNHMRKSFPILDFDQSHFMRGTTTILLFDQRKRKLSFDKRMKEFINFVDVSMNRFCKLDLYLRKFKLLVTHFKDYNLHSAIHKWIVLAMENGVEEIDLNIQTDEESAYTLPPAVYFAKSLTTLELCGCKLDEPSDTISLYSLRKLSLREVTVNEQIFTKITSECLLLGDIFVECCKGLNRIHVSKLLGLKLLIVKQCEEVESVEILVPSLEQIELQVKKSCVIRIAGCLGLKYLRLHGSSCTDQEFNNLMSKFPSLKSLSIGGCHSLERVGICSNGMKKLSIDFCPNLKAIDIDTPNLSYFYFGNSELPIYSINAPCKWEVQLRKQGDIDTSWFLKLKEFLSAAHQIGYMYLYLAITSKQNVFDLHEFRSNSSSPPVKIGKMHLHLDDDETAPISESLVDGVLCCCYPQRLLVTTCGPAAGELVKWMYKEMKYFIYKKCCTRDVKCWRHYLRDVEDEFLPLDGKIVPDDALPIDPEGLLMFNLRWCFDIWDQ